jgi:hypothetical protein
MGTGGGLERPKRRTRPCMQVEGSRGRGRAHSSDAVACRSLSCTSPPQASKGENKVQGGRAEAKQQPWKLAVEALRWAIPRSSRRKQRQIAAAMHSGCAGPTLNHHSHTRLADRYSNQRGTFDAYRRYNCDKPHLSLCMKLTI